MTRQKAYIWFSLACPCGAVVRGTVQPGNLKRAMRAFKAAHNHPQPRDERGRFAQWWPA